MFRKINRNIICYVLRFIITYDVNFSHLIGAFEKNGAKTHRYSTKMSALVAFGLIELLDILYQKSTKGQYEKEANRAKTLIDPSFMGERFKMICFRKEVLNAINH